MPETTISKAYKAFFLGPKAENAAWTGAEFQAVLDHWFNWRKGLFPGDPPISTAEERQSAPYLRARAAMTEGLETLTELLSHEMPKYTPRYIGHMVADLSLPALLGHFAALLHNPNNTCRDASWVGTRIETDVIAMLATMVGYDPAKAHGHITGGGTVANFEAVWRARFRQDHWLSLALYLAEKRGLTLPLMEAGHMGWHRFGALLNEYDVRLDDLRGYSGIASNPYAFGERMTAAFGLPYRGPVLLVPENKHFSWTKATNVFGFGEESFWPIALDDMGRLNIASLQEQIDHADKAGRPITMVVSVAGTTETGKIDPIDRVQDVLDQTRATRGWDIWHHVDAAYGGFLCSMLRGPNPADALSPSNTAALASISRVHSVTIDPHKLGYVPYACGAILTRDTQAYAVSSFKAPYLERQLEMPDKWSTTLEGSRSAAGATATWLTGKTLGFDAGGMGGVIAATIGACRQVKDRLAQLVPAFRPLEPTDTNILCFSLAREGDSLKAANAATEAMYDRFATSPDFAVSKTTLGVKSHRLMIERHTGTYDGPLDDDHLVLLRMVFMNPFWAEDKLRDQLSEELATFLNT
ncbi:pyridoxal phosphate-dependent decarboxylase family protein [Kordiimonas marina]|uniref:pyridoxal phosphate-dependent decarboxylase family protein n=1 Tax=Kordiimonas marina TaxID=2872312 RepID=UPI001FF1BFE6|nr:pyridoxal-dependent decarboxylase [Kordiimonas marina]MCJ9428203.1 hypothetical protein [Kordiimonas marina]